MYEARQKKEKQSRVLWKNIKGKSPLNERLKNNIGTFPYISSYAHLLQAKWKKSDKEDGLKWDRLLDGIQWYYNIYTHTMKYEIVDNRKIKPSMLSLYKEFENQWKERTFFVTASPFGDIYGNLNAEIANEEVNDNDPFVNEESLPGAWREKILKEDNWENDLKKYLNVVYSDNSLYYEEKDEEKEKENYINLHINNIVKEINKKKRYIISLQKGKDENKSQNKKIDEIDEKIEQYKYDIYALIPNIPLSGTKLLINKGNISNTKFPYLKLILDNGKIKIIRNGQEIDKENKHYCFIITSHGNIYLNERVNGGHIILSRGGDVYFAGEISFDSNGKVKEWTNSSGHYRTPEEQKKIIGELGLSNLLPDEKFRKV